MKANHRISIALDLDKTLATYDSKWKIAKIGPIIEPMKEKVLSWLSKGYDVEIFTARVSRYYDSNLDQARIAQEQTKMIQDWLSGNGLPRLEVTAIKKIKFTHFVDDKAFHCVPNEGELIGLPPELV